MLSNYLAAAMRHARYEILTDDHSYYGEIPPCQGVWSNAATLEECRNELVEVLESWLFFRISRNLPLPTIDGLALEIREVA